jgi:hypothetical protein
MSVTRVASHAYRFTAAMLPRPAGIAVASAVWMWSRAIGSGSRTRRSAGVLDGAAAAVGAAAAAGGAGSVAQTPAVVEQVAGGGAIALGRTARSRPTSAPMRADS